jgi:dynamin family protein
VPHADPGAAPGAALDLLLPEVPAMSATGTPAKSFESSLAQLKQWRESSAESLATFRRWATVGRLLDEQTAARLAHLERRLSQPRFTIAFVGEHSRGKSELINALFFADIGVRVLPSASGRTIQCPTEILWDPARAPSIRLLPIETRENARALREYFDDSAEWTEVALDIEHPEAFATTCEVLLEAIDENTPRWRYAQINLPHPLLAAGLALLDTAGFVTLASEPELSFHRVPEAAAIVYTISVDMGITLADRTLWSEHVATIAGVDASCFVALNKIDGLRNPAKPESQVMAEIDAQVRSAAETLGISPTRVYPVSARQAVTGKLKGDRDMLVRSRLFRLEQALARGIVQGRHASHATEVRAEARGALGETRALVTSRLAFANDQVEELTALQGKNQKLIELLAKKAGVERGRLEQARATFASMRTQHNRYADELARLLDPNEARAAGQRARAAVAGSAFSKGIGEALDAFFHESREKIERAIALIREAKGLMASVSRKFNDEYKVATVEALEFGTERFLVELDRIEEQAEAEFKGGTSLFMRSRKSLGTLFFDTVALKVINVFEIADRETRAWMGGFVRPLEAQMNAYQEQSNARIEGMGRIQNAEVDLISRLEEVKRLAADLAAQKDELDAHTRRIMSLLDEAPGT